MVLKLLACFALLSTSGAMAATPGLLLGMDYSEVTDGGLIATDNSGALYLRESADCEPSSDSCIRKLAADGTTVIWQYPVDGAASAAVDPNGGVYIAEQNPNTPGTLVAEKLTANGAGVAWKVTAGTGANAETTVLAAVDAAGRMYVAYSHLSQTVVVRVKADGSGLDYTVQWPGLPSLLAADGTGSAILVLSTGQGAAESFVLTRLSADGTSQAYSIPVGFPASVTADSTGNVVVVQPNPDPVKASLLPVLQRFDPQGDQTLSVALPGVASEDIGPVTYFEDPQVTFDAAGNMYVVGTFLAHAVKNSVASCSNDGLGTSLMVYGPDGSLLDGTYVPGSSLPPNLVPPAAVVVGPGPVAYVLAADGTLTRLSQNSAAKTLPLACVANAAGFYPGGVAPGGIVALFGNGLGPQQGVQTQATLQNPFPTHAEGSAVTFDGKPAPLLWVQDGQINAVVPWSLTPGQNTTICVTHIFSTTNCLTEPVSETSPGVLTVDGVYAAAINQDGTINSAEHPAHLNSEVTFYAIGLGPINPAWPDGSLVGLPLPVNVLALDITMTGPPSANLTAGLTVDYAGPAPDELAGLTQIDAHLYGSVVPPFPFAVIVTGAGGSGSNPFRIYVTAP